MNLFINLILFIEITLHDFNANSKDFDEIEKSLQNLDVDQYLKS